jgi:hypothetical protein
VQRPFGLFSSQARSDALRLESYLY